ncbi:MAG: hypothetical protein KC425_11385 [Anaerolineales bacterium]|nr:hypothetical protein [Anaerolineales bacterium]
MLIVFGISQLTTYDSLLIFFLLTILAIGSQITTTVLGEDVMVDVSTAVAMSVVFIYDPFAAALVSICATTAAVVSNFRSNWQGWERAATRVLFNIGMVGSAMLCAGVVFQYSRSLLGEDTLLGNTLPWLLAALVNDQINLWLLVGILHIQNQVKPLDIWHQHKWAIPINVLVISVGGGILALAVTRFDILGIAIFFLPVVLSAYSFRLYVNQTRRQMERLEELVAERTNDLSIANKELAELHKTKDAYLAVLTHDMRTPLSSIKGYASVLSKGTLSADQQKHISKILTRSQDSLMEIVNNILDIEKLQSGKPIELDRTDFDLAYLVTLVSETLVGQAAEKEIALHFDPAPDMLMVNGDREKLKRVIMNLVSNAVKYTDEGGSVHVSTRISDNYAVVDVTDTGFGIPTEELPYIFDRFRRVKGHQHLAVGTGLGLAIVKSLVEAHGGEINVTSQENVGSTFSVSLPCQDVSQPALS